MLSQSIDGSGTLRVMQTNEPPNVYLDHGILMEMAEDSSLANRFITTLKRRHGTLSLSWVNLAEFAKIENERQIQTVERFVDTISPQLFFIAVDPWEVIQSEDEVVRRRHRPHSEWGDLDLLKVFVTRKVPQSLNPFTAEGLFSHLREPHILHNLDKLGNLFMNQIESLRKHYVEDTEFAKAVRRRPQGSALLPATRFLLHELLGFSIKTPMQKLTRRDAADFFHAVVPLAYCNYVGLDGHWATQASIAAKHLYQTGQIETIAQAFSQRQKGISKFLNAFESD